MIDPTSSAPSLSVTSWNSTSLARFPSLFHKLDYVLFVLYYRIFTSAGNQQGMDRQGLQRNSYTKEILE